MEVGEEPTPERDKIEDSIHIKRKNRSTGWFFCVQKAHSKA